MPKLLVEATPISLDLLHPSWKEALRNEEPSSGLSTWTLGEKLLANARWRLDSPAEDGPRLLGVAIFEGERTVSQMLTLLPVKVGFSQRWHARCPIGCGSRAQKLYLSRGRPGLACWKCAGLQYRSAAKHNAREGKLVKDPEALLAALEKANARGRVPAGYVMRALDKWDPNLFRPGRA